MPKIIRRIQIIITLKSGDIELGIIKKADYKLAKQLIN